ncbi:MULTISPECIES: spore cortex biosynthesis protein YabQ [Caproicibacterium]|uniref:Spore cortex biosynthesis protein YabQ n=1 Tax=Caproicibacterium argilliputei TaxID=3030016 RepID=A0AA97D9I6_9FIRM|nr:spore cortex biosynthesis protein YabQ [Caproicibacterium argilliputei]WOC31523.1 spore cortex biosynthesis protein YabQ [Caproicibacterium argilliputei]
MDASNAQNLFAFLLFTALGAALSVVWCVLRAVRAQLREKGAFSIVLEALFGVLCAVCIKLLALGVYWGEVRGFLLLGAGLGFWAVYETAGRLLTFCICALLRACVRFLLRPLGRLVCGIGRFFSKALAVPVRFVKKVLQSVKNSLKSARRFVYNKKNAKSTAKGRNHAGRGRVKADAGSQQTQKTEKYAKPFAGSGHPRVWSVYARTGGQSAVADSQSKGKAAKHPK